MGILYLIADFSYGEERICSALAAGVDYVQLREKEVSSAEYLRRARRMRELTREYGEKLIINDRLDIALLCGADGVHLGQSDVPIADARSLLGELAIIGATARTAEQASLAEAAGADYVGSGAWFPTRTKADAAPISEAEYRAILDATTIPNLAIGGITAKNCAKPLRCGAGGLAVSAGILRARDPAAEVRKIRETMRDIDGNAGGDFG